MAIELRAVSYSPSPAFAFNDLDEEVDTNSDSSPEIPIAELPSPPTSWLPASDMNMYGARPLFPDVALVTCKDCNKPVQESALAEHAINCEKIRSETGEPEGGKKRKADELSGDGTLEPSASGGGVLGNVPVLGANGGPPKKKKKTTVKAGKTGKARVKPPIDVDKQCGVFDDKKNATCTRSITCKVHSMLAKRALPGRSKPYDELLLDWKRANDPKFVEPVPKPPRVPKVKGEGAPGGTGAGTGKKKEAKERKERERQEKRAADIAAGLIDPNTPFVTPKKKKSKKAPGANGVTGSNAGPGGAGPAEYDSEDGKDLDSDVEVDALISSVHRSRAAFHPYSSGNLNPSTRNSRPIPPSATQAQGQGPASAPVGGPSPLARPQNATNFFVARNEVLRCCADILVKALQKPVGGTNASNGSGTMGANGGSNGTSGGGLGAGALSW